MRWGTDQIRLMLLRIEPISLYTILANHYIGVLTLISLIIILYTLLHDLRFQCKTHDILRYPHTPTPRVHSLQVTLIKEHSTLTS